MPSFRSVPIAKAGNAAVPKAVDKTRPFVNLKFPESTCKAFGVVIVTFVEAIGGPRMRKEAADV